MVEDGRHVVSSAGGKEAVLEVADSPVELGRSAILLFLRVGRI